MENFKPPEFFDGKELTLVFEPPQKPLSLQDLPISIVETAYKKTLGALSPIDPIREEVKLTLQADSDFIGINLFEGVPSSTTAPDPHQGADNLIKSAERTTYYQDHDLVGIKGDKELIEALVYQVRDGLGQPLCAQHKRAAFTVLIEGGVSPTESIIGVKNEPTRRLLKKIQAAIQNHTKQITEEKKDDLLSEEEVKDKPFYLDIDT